MEGGIRSEGQDNDLKKLSKTVSVERGHMDRLSQMPHVTEQGLELPQSRSEIAGALWLPLTPG